VARYRDLELPDARGVDGERRRQAQAGVQRVAIDICTPPQITDKLSNKGITGYPPYEIGVGGG
jgi:hypothetical protein